MRHHLSMLAVAVATVSLAGGALAEDAMAKKAEDQAAIHGYCPVAYVEMAQAVKGDPQWAIDHEGHHYVFASAKALELFEADPAKYTVAYGGWCATAAAGNKYVEADPTIFVATDGTTYLFSSADAKKAYEKKPADFAYDPAYDGWCATALAKGKKVRGDAAIFTVVEGVTYLFSSKDAKTAFDKDTAGIRAKADEQWAETQQDSNMG